MKIVDKMYAFKHDLELTDILVNVELSMLSVSYCV